MRMLVILGLALLIGLAGLSNGADAAEKGTIELSPTAGVSIPFSDFGDFATAGFAIGGQGGYYIAPATAIGGAVVFNSFGTDEAFTDADISILELNGYFKYLFLPERDQNVYAKFTTGFFSTEVAGFSQTDFGIGGGVGYQASTGGQVGFFGEAMVQVVFTEVQSSNYLALRGGLNFLLGGTE